ncbi:MAG: SPOR domain-containing protein [Bacteroidales bacterium]|nr:SPOR domain-containing protein [Bacteroidales bacterium]
MKKIFGFLLMALIIGFTATSCKSKQKVVEISGADIPATETQQPTQPVVVNQVESNERTIDESFKLADGEMNSDAFNRRYHVVVGSFSVQNNAKNLQRTLNNEGNNAIIVVNERGMYRVLIASYDDYSQARNRINQISNRFPDAWVLRQK